MTIHPTSNGFSTSEIHPYYQGPYDRLYAASPDYILWGDTPTHLLQHIPSRNGLGTSLDVGCGDGVNSLALEQMGFRNVGIDISTIALQGLRNRAAIADFQLAGRYFQADLGRESEWNTVENVDVIVSCGLYHCLGAARRLESQRRIFGNVKRGGTILFSSLIDDVAIDYDHGTDPFDLPNADEIEQLFDGLNVLNFKTGRIADRHPPIVGEHEHAVAWVVARA